MRFLCVNGFSTCSCTRSLVIVVLVIEGRSALILKVIVQICENYFSCRVEEKTPTSHSPFHQLADILL